MKFIKSVLALAAAVFIGASAQAATRTTSETISLDGGAKTFTYNNLWNSAHSGWSATVTTGDAVTAEKTNTGTTMDTASPSVKVTPVKAGRSTITVKRTGSSGSSDNIWELTVTVEAAPAEGETTLDLAYGQSATVTTSASISSISPASPTYVTVSRNGTKTTFTAKSTTGSEVIQLKDSSGKLIKKVTVNVTDPSQKSVSLYFGEVAEFTLTNAQNVSWSATASGNVRLMTAATTAATSQNASSTKSFTIKINGYTDSGSGTVIVKQGQNTVMTYNCTVTADIDEETQGGYNKVAAARKQLTLYMGEPLTLTYYKTSTAKWRFVDAEITSAMFTDRSKYTYKELGVFKASTSKNYTYSKGSSGTASTSANLTSGTSSDFDAKVEGVKVGKGSLAVCSGSNQPSHYAAYYEVTVYQPIAVPTGATLTYNGNTQTGVASGTGYTVSGTASAKAAGTYQAIVTPNQYYCWPDHSTDAKVIEWTIAAKSATVTADPKSMTQGGQVPALTYTSTGLVGTDKFTGALACAVTSASPAGEYPITIGTLTNANYAITYFGAVVTVINPRTKINYPTPATGLVYGFTNQVGVAEGPYYTLSGVAVTNTVGTHTAYATPDKDHCWQDGTYGAYQIDWSIDYRPATVTVVSTNKLFGAEEPIYQTKNEGFIAEDPTELIWTVWRTNASETVGTYDVLVAGEEFQGGYQISYNKGTLEIRAGKMTVNGKGYDNITDAFQDLLQNKGSATFNDTGIVYDDMTFQRGSTLTVAADNSWTVTNNGGTSLIATKIPGKMNLTVDGTFELSGDIFVAPMGEDDTIVTVTNFLLDASITVGKESNGATDAMAYLTFNTFTNEDPANRITLTTNGVIRSEEKLTIADVFTEPTKIKETQVDGWWEYTYLPLIPVDVPEAVDGLVYNGNEQTGVVENVGFTLTGNFATNADDYTAEAELANGYCWADDGSVTNKFIDWSIGKFAITVTPVATNKLVGAEDPELTYTTDVEPVEGDEFTGKLARSEGEDVGTYNITQGTLAIDDENYDLTFETAAGENAFEIKAGVINVNGKGYATVEEAFAALVLAAKSGTATATFNEEVEAQGYKFAQGAVLTIEEGGKWSLTGDVTMPMVEKEKKVSVDGALTLAGDIFVGDRADVTTEVVATNVVLAADVTVGAATEGFDTVGIAVLAFEEIAVGDYKLTLTTNGVVQSAERLDIDEVFEEVKHFEVVEKEVEGVYVYTLEASEFKVNYYDNDGETVVKSDTATILDYKKLHIWSGDRTSEGLELVKYEKETGGELARTDEALWAYIEEEAADDYCDGEVKVFGTWEKLNITIHVKADEETITEVWSGEDPVANDDLELPAETKEVTLTLEADVNLTVPVFKVVRGNVTNVTTKVATYAIKDGDTLEFFAEEAEWTDPDVTDDDIKTALIESIDDDDPDTREAAEKKVNDVVGTGAKQVSARNLATYITDRHIQSSEIADCDYVAASVKLDTDDLITEETEVEIAELVKAEGDGLTFEVYIGEDQQSLSLVEVEAIKDMVEATSDLTDWVTDEHKLDVEAEFDPDECKVTITPVNPTDKAFMRVVIPKDPGVK